MKTTLDLMVQKGLLAGMLSLLIPTALHGDEWEMPRIVTVSSPSSNCIVLVIPGRGMFGGYERAITNRELNARAVVSGGPGSGITNVLWSGALVNPEAPVEVYISDGGYLVTMDNWHNVGYGPVVAIYDPKGRLLRYWTLDELFSAEEKVRLQHSVSSIWWHNGRAHFGGGAETNLLIVPAVGKSFRFALTNATLLPPSATLGNVEPDGAAHGSQPIGSETNRTSSAAGSGR